VAPSRARRPAGAGRLILYVGKGGVGKTSVAAATAVRAAELGHRTLVVSTDVAHSLGDALATELGGEPREVAERLHAQEIDVLEEARRSWGKVQAHLADMLRREGVPAVQADELAILPGMDELAALVEIGRRTRAGDFDCVVVDAAPTGETIRLLSTPESFQWYAARIEDWRARLTRFVGPLMRGLVPDLNVVDVMSRLAERVRDLRGVLTDPSRSSYRIVVTPDRMVLKEAQRAETYLNLFEYPIDAVVLNRLVPPQPPGNAYLDALIARQGQLADQIRAAFPTLPLLTAPWLVDEPIGVAALSGLARDLFGQRDPTEVLHVGPTQRVVSRGDAYVLQIPMPNVEVDRLGLMKRGDQLYVEVGNVRREITLPAALAALEPGAARLQEGRLEIPFARAGAATPGRR
jgi:arsenite-transporting ATPase